MIIYHVSDTTWRVHHMDESMSGDIDGTSYNSDRVQSLERRAEREREPERQRLE